ncbi:MAG TPA: DNA-formamidopyrimidine glycosylase family protein [Acidimicrobiales bacterium]
MPEGDTIHRTATALRAALLDKVMTAFEAPRLTGRPPVVGSVVERVDSRGKHIEIGWDDGTILHTHLRMAGSWHLYRPGERWRKGTRHMRAVIEVEGFEAVCFNAPVVETFRASDFASHPGRRTLGPDLCGPDLDLAGCVERIPQFCDETTTAAELLLDQRVAAGVGNVYKSEVLWACGVHPSTSVAAIDLETRWGLLETASAFLRANLDQPTRTTLPGSTEGVAVYGRYGKPCYRCGTPIEVRRHGEQSRVTYWCPDCQQRQDAVVPAWARADAPTPVDFDTARQRRRPPPVSFDDTGDVSGPIDPAEVAPALERHPASRRLLDGFQPRGPEPSYVDPLLGREEA